MLRFVSLLILVLGVLGIAEVSAQNYPALAQELNGSWIDGKETGDPIFETQFSWGLGLGDNGFDFEFDLGVIPNWVKDCQVIDAGLSYKIILIEKLGPKSLRVTTEVLGTYEHPFRNVTDFTFLDHERMIMYRKGTDGTAYNGKTIWYRLSGPGEYLGKLVKIYSPIVKLKQ